MSDPAAQSTQPGAVPSSQAAADAAAREALAGIAKWWWLFLITAVAWAAVAFILFQFDAASLATVGVLVGAMLIFSGIEQIIVAGAAQSMKWFFYLFGVIFIVGGTIALFNPLTTAASLALSLGLFFGLIGVFWAIEAILTRNANPLWWVGLLSAAVMIGLAFWIGSQSATTRAVTLLIFAGTWALVHAVSDVVRAIQLKKVGKLVAARQ
jgi:uncharacterized membrane protein HdeD (DUF308 family)